MIASQLKIKGLLQVFFNYSLDLLTNIIILKLVSVNLSKYDFGFYSLILSVFSFVSIFPFFSLHTAMERMSIEYKFKEKKFQFQSLFFVHIFFAFIYLLLIFLFKSFLNSHWENIIYIFYFFTLTRIYRTFYILILNVQEKRKLIVNTKIIDSIIQVGILFLAINYNKFTINVILISSIIGNLISLIIYFFVEKDEFKSVKFSKKIYLEVLKEILIYSYPLIIWSIFIWAQNMIGRWYLNYFLDRVWVANYSVMTSLALLPSTAFISIFAGYFVPVFYRKEKDHPGFIRNYNNKLLWWSIVFWIFVIIITYFFKDFFITVFLDKKYIDISWMLPYLMIGTAFYSIGQTTIYEIYYYKLPKKLIISNILPGLVSVILGYFLIKNYKINGAIITYILSFCISGIMTIIISKKFSRDIILRKV